MIGCRDDLDKAQRLWLDEQTEYEDAHLGNFRRVFPPATPPSLGGGSSDAPLRYDKYFESSATLYQETAAYKARSECSRYGLSLCLPVCLCAYLSVCLSFYLSFYLSVCLCLPVCLSVCVSVCLPTLYQETAAYKARSYKILGYKGPTVCSRSACMA